MRALTTLFLLALSTPALAVVPMTDVTVTSNGTSGSLEITGTAERDAIIVRALPDGSWVVSNTIDGDDYYWTGPAHAGVYIDGLAGDDILWVAVRADYATIYGDDGDDSVLCASKDGCLAWLGSGDDTYQPDFWFDEPTGIHVVFGEGGADDIFGDDGDDVVFGGSGPDNIYGYGGDDDLRGESGSDTIYGGDGDDHIEGGEGDDWLYGGRNADRIWGNEGDDQIYGNEGGDTLWGNGGLDNCYGGSGNDTLKFSCWN
ncbi:MAG: calcium-binding protein [bacterium]